MFESHASVASYTDVLRAIVFSLALHAKIISFENLQIPGTYSVPHRYNVLTQIDSLAVNDSNIALLYLIIIMYWFKKLNQL